MAAPCPRTRRRAVYLTDAERQLVCETLRTVATALNSRAMGSADLGPIARLGWELTTEQQRRVANLFDDREPQA